MTNTTIENRVQGAIIPGSHDTKATLKSHEAIYESGGCGSRQTALSY